VKGDEGGRPEAGFQTPSRPDEAKAEENQEDPENQRSHPAGKLHVRYEEVEKGYGGRVSRQPYAAKGVSERAVDEIFCSTRVPYAVDIDSRCRGEIDEPHKQPEEDQHHQKLFFLLIVKEGHEPFLHVLDTPLREHVKRFSECTKLSRLLGFCQMPGEEERFRRLRLFGYQHLRNRRKTCYNHTVVSLEPMAAFKHPVWGCSLGNLIGVAADRDVGVYTAQQVAIDWTDSFDYQKLKKEEIEKYSSMEVTEDLHEGGIHALKAWAPGIARVRKRWAV
jgi:hypothetical protein